MTTRLGIGGHFAAVMIATGAVLGCEGTHAAETHAILLRGYLGLFSDGLDRLAQELRARGINAEVRKHLYWTTTVSDILRERAAGKVGALILMGHSQGGNDAIEIARALEISHAPVDLLVTFDPYHQKPVPANVARAINYYQRGLTQPTTPELSVRPLLRSRWADAISGMPPEAEITPKLHVHRRERCAGWHWRGFSCRPVPPCQA
jgi:hypothetical protein